MATASLMQTNFNAGVFSPLLEGFIDTPKRGHAVRSAYNLISLKQGPLARRVVLCSRPVPRILLW